MNVGELFLELGIKGADKSIGALTNVKKGLGEAKSMSLEMKAAIVGAFYALEKLMSASGRTGTGLTNFNATTGASVQELQKWQYAARQAGATNEDMTNSFKAVQQAMTNMSLGKGAPEGMGRMLNAVGDFDRNKINDTFYVMQKLQEARQKLGPQVGGQVLKSFGVSEGIDAAMAKNEFRPDVMNKAPTYSNNEIGQLDKANIAWGNLGNKVEMAFGHFTAKHGTQMVKDMSLLVDKVIKLTEAFVRLADSIKLFEKVGKVVENVGVIFDNVTSLVGDKNESTFEKIKNTVKGAGLSLSDAMALPAAPNVPGANNSTASSNSTVNQTNHFHGAKDHKELAQHVGRELKHAVKTSPAIAGGQ